MTWKDMGTLTPNRLAMLHFGDTKAGHWIGYVDHHGICQWPTSVCGLRPTGWQEVVADHTWFAPAGMA